MAKSSAKKEESTKEIDIANDPSAVLGKYLHRVKQDHYNFVPDVNWEVSSGSLNLDTELGPFRPGIVRLSGNPSSGKTSFSFGVAKNFLETVPNSRVIYVKSEGRLSQNIQDRSGLSFTKDYEKFTNGMVFIFECSVYEAVIGLFRELIMNNPQNIIYMFILDSMDALNLRSDMSKTIEEGNKVAGAPLMTKQLLQKMSVPIEKYGHLCFFLGQISAEIKASQYVPSANRQVTGAGGNAIQHFSTTVLNFLDWHESDLILDNPNERLDRIKNRSVGHNCRIKISKSDNETRYFTVEIPIRHNQTGGKSIWREREVADQLIAWQLISHSGAWITVSDTIRQEIGEALGLKDGDESYPPEKINGINKVYAYLDKNPKVTDYLFNRFKTLIASSKTTK